MTSHSACFIEPPKKSVLTSYFVERMSPILKLALVSRGMDVLPLATKTRKNAFQPGLDE